MARYPDPSTVNWSAGLQEAPKYINTVTNGLVTNLILLTIAIIIGTSYWYTKRDLPGALAVGSFVTWVVGTLFWMGDLLAGWNYIFLTAVMFGAVAYIIVSTNENG